MTRVVVYARTSGDEADTGQDVQAQGRHTSQKATEAGHEVVACFLEDGVSGSVPASQRRAWQKAVALAELEGAAILVREVSRFSRFAPHGAMVELDELPVEFVSLKEPHFADTGQADPSNLLLRFVSLWQAWAELQGIRAKTQAAMDDLADGRRATKSGRPVGRPKVVVAPEHLAACRPVLEVDGLLAAYRHCLELRGYNGVVDPAAKKARYVSREAFATQMGLRPAKNPDRPKTPDGQEGEFPAANGPVVDRAAKAAVVAGVLRKEPVEPVGADHVAAGGAP